MQIIKPLALLTVFVAGFVNSEFLMQESATNITTNSEESDAATNYNTNVSWGLYDCINCLKSGYYYCEYSETYNTGNCDTTSFYWCTTQYSGYS